MCLETVSREKVPLKQSQEVASYESSQGAVAWSDSSKSMETSICRERLQRSQVRARANMVTEEVLLLLQEAKAQHLESALLTFHLPLVGSGAFQFLSQGQAQGYL